MLVEEAKPYLRYDQATRVVTKNLDRVTTTYIDYLQKKSLYIYVHEMNLYRKIVTIYEAKKRRDKDNAKF